MEEKLTGDTKKEFERLLNLLFMKPRIKLEMEITLLLEIQQANA
ncbi:MAG: hypothetical protein U0I48_03440 [Acutalibacteraceae bacterium]|nr:hypothetical protein [Acutalibacteraceae bacterium]